MKMNKVFITIAIFILMGLSTTYAADITKTIQAVFATVNLCSNSIKKEEITVIKYNNETYIPWSKVSKLLQNNTSFDGKNLNILSKIVDPSEIKVKDNYNIGEETLMHDGLKIKINNITKTRNIQRFQTQSMLKENKYSYAILVDTSITNTADKNLWFSWTGPLGLINSKGQYWSSGNGICLERDLKREVNVNKLAPNGVADAVVVYLLPDNYDATTFEISDQIGNLINGKQVHYKFDISKLTFSE